MVETYDHFVQRLTRVGRKHKKMTQGYTTHVGRDGLITVRPKRRARNASGIKFLVLFVAGFFGLKALMLASLGPDAYTERLALLQEGTVIEQVGAAALGIDPLTTRIVETVGPILR